MPRINLDEEEHQVILRLREEKRFFRAGYVKGVTDCADIVQKVLLGEMTPNEAFESLKELAR